MINSEDEYVIDWKINNFSTCPLASGKKLSTCELTFQNLDNTTWKIHLYPKGEIDERYISCFLTRTGKNNERPRKLCVNFEFSLITSDGLQCEKTVMHDCNFFEPEMNLGFNIITREDLFDDEENYLPKDILTLRCRIGKYTPQTRQNCYNVFRTRNVVQTSNIRLPIENLENVTKSNLELLHVKTAKENDFLTLIVHTGKDEAFKNHPEKTASVKDVDSTSNSLLHIDIERCKPLTTPVYPMYVFCQVKLVDKDKSFPFELAEEHIYKGQLQKETWNFSRFIKIKELTKDMIQDNTLLEFNIQACDGLQSTYLEEDLALQLPRYIENDKALKEDLASLYESGLFSDAKLKVGNEYFSVHKSILCIRSSIFKKLFEEHANTENAVSQNEKECILELTNIRRDSLTRMLKFIYTDVLDVQDFDSCLSLYAGAHKYDIPLLKMKCYNFLKDHMSLRQSSKTLELAEELSNRHLLILLLHFMENNRETFSSKDFTALYRKEIRKIFQELDKKLRSFLQGRLRHTNNENLNSEILAAANSNTERN